MTIAEMTKSEKVFLTSKDIAPLLHCDPYDINMQAHEDQSKLGFQTIVIGRAVKIPRIPFLKFIGAVYGVEVEITPCTDAS